MLYPIICVTCGMSIGDRAPVFRRLYQRQVELSLQGVKAENAYAAPGLRVDCSAALDQVGATNACCRAELLTTMQFNDHY